jgi:hypothetical protein
VRPHELACTTRTSLRGGHGAVSSSATDQMFAVDVDQQLGVDELPVRSRVASRDSSFGCERTCRAAVLAAEEPATASPRPSREGYGWGHHHAIAGVHFTKNRRSWSIVA